jgi:hypothetical protein
MCGLYANPIQQFRWAGIGASCQRYSYDELAHHEAALRLVRVQGRGWRRKVAAAREDGDVKSPLLDNQGQVRRFVNSDRT